MEEQKKPEEKKAGNSIVDKIKAFFKRTVQP